MRSHHFAVIASVLTILVFGAAGGLLGALLTGIGREFGITAKVTGLLLPATFAGSAVSVLVAGYCADRFGKRPLFLLSLAGLACVYAGLSLSPSFFFIALGCLLAGALGGALEGLCSAVIADIDPAHTDRNMNLLQVTFSVGAAAMLLVASRMISDGGIDIDWRGTYAVLAASSAAIFLIALPMRVPPPLSAPPITLPRALGMAKDKAVLLLAVAIALYVGSEMSLAWWISPLLEKAHGHLPSMAAMGAMLFWLAMGIGRLVSGLACRRHAGAAVLRWHIAGGVLAYLLLLLPLGEWRLWAGAAFAGFTFSGVWPLLVSLGSARYPGYSGTVVALLVASGTVGGLVFTALPGFVLGRGGAHAERAGIALMAALFLLLAVVVWIYGRLPRQRAAKTDALPEGVLAPGGTADG